MSEDRNVWEFSIALTWERQPGGPFFVEKRAVFTLEVAPGVDVVRSALPALADQLRDNIRRIFNQEAAINGFDLVDADTEVDPDPPVFCSECGKDFDPNEIKNLCGICDAACCDDCQPQHQCE